MNGRILQDLVRLTVEVADWCFIEAPAQRAATTAAGYQFFKSLLAQGLGGDHPTADQTAQAGKTSHVDVD